MAGPAVSFTQKHLAALAVELQPAGLALLLLALAHEGRLPWGQELLAARVGLQKRSVERALAGLLASGAMKREAGTGRGRCRVLYTLQPWPWPFIPQDVRQRVEDRLVLAALEDAQAIDLALTRELRAALPAWEIEEVFTNPTWVNSVWSLALVRRQGNAPNTIRRWWRVLASDPILAAVYLEPIQKIGVVCPPHRVAIQADALQKLSERLQALGVHP